MTYFRKLRKATVHIVASLMAASVFPALAVTCDDIFLVKPPDQLAGSIYLNSVAITDPLDNHTSHPRQGYLPVGTLLIKESKNASALLRDDYAGFIAANGTQGLVKNEHIKQLGELLKEEGGVINCNSIKWIVIPVSPVRKVQVYRGPANNTEKLTEAFSFSRSAFRLVVVSSDKLKTEQIGADHFYPVQYAENIGSHNSPRWRLNNGLLKREDRRDIQSSELNGTYRFTRLDYNNFNPFEVTSGDSEYGILDFLEDLLSENEIEAEFDDNRPTMKNCGEEETITLTRRFSGDLNFLTLLGIGASVSNETTIRFPSHEKYTLKSFDKVLVDSDQKVKVLKTILCYESMMHYTIMMRVILGSNVVFIQQEVLDVLRNNAFTTPNVSGIEDKPRDRMFVVPNNPEADIFTPFARLEQFLTSHTYNINGVGVGVGQQRLITLLLNEMILWGR